MSKWKDVIKSVAPVLGTAIGGPMAGAAIKTLGNILLPGENNPTERQIEQAVLNSHPDQLVLIKQADHDFEVKMKELDVDVFALEVDDRNSARHYGKESWVPAFLTIGLSALIGIILFALFYVEPPEGAREILYMILGIVVREWAGSMHYWFGTTKGSKDKTDLMKAR